jgi:delta8-fatty-acid desaturase
MGAYRIGRIDEPWINFTPPIRGGVYRKFEQSDDEESSAASDEEISSLGSRLASPNSSTTSLDLLSDHELGTRKEGQAEARTTRGGKLAVAKLTHRRAATAQDGVLDEKLFAVTSHHVRTREDFVSDTVQKEIDDCIRDYPSLDPDTQRAITKKYQALHERVKNEGFYDCRYREYGVEAIRYSILFCAFLFFLRAEWYLTSAAFLGLFWVCSPPEVAGYG